MISPALSNAYKKKFNVIVKNDKLGNYLMDGYQEYLPDEFMGWRSTEEMVIDYCDLKRHEERQSTLLP